MGKEQQSLTRGVGVFALITALVTFLPIVMGSVVRTTGSGSGCGSGNTGDWPLCNGHFFPAPNLNTLIEFSHRMLATLLTICVAILVLWVLRKYRHVPFLMVGSLATLFFLLMQIALGAITVKVDLAGPLVFIHLANAELLFAVALTTGILAIVRSRGGIHPGVDQSESAAVRIFPWLVACLIGTYILIVVGSLVVNVPGAANACPSWPFCGHGFAWSIPSVGAASLNVFHRFIAGFIALFAGFVMGAKVLKSYRWSTAITRLAILTNVLIVLQIAIGAVMVLTDLSTAWEILHLAFATLYWGSVVSVSVLIWEYEVGQQRSQEFTGVRHHQTAPTGAMQ